LTAAQFDTRRHWPTWILFAAGLAIADQATKAIVADALPLHARVEVTPWFNFVHVLNPGAAFSFLADASGWQRYLLSAIGLAVSAVLLWMLWRGVKNRVEAVAYAAISGGALGNVIDRVRLGAVVDYLDFYWREWHWPAFNLADILVVGGAGLLMAASVLPKTRSTARGNPPTLPPCPEQREATRI